MTHTSIMGVKKIKITHRFHPNSIDCHQFWVTNIELETENGKAVFIAFADQPIDIIEQPEIQTVQAQQAAA